MWRHGKTDSKRENENNSGGFHKIVPLGLEERTLKTAYSKGSCSLCVTFKGNLGTIVPGMKTLSWGVVFFDDTTHSKGGNISRSMDDYIRMEVMSFLYVISGKQICWAESGLPFFSAIFRYWMCAVKSKRNSST